MIGRRMNRRAMIGGATVYAGASLLPSQAHAFLPAALIRGISTLVTLWNGFKMAEEVYERFFADRTRPIVNEVNRGFASSSFNTDSYYNFGNPYKVPSLRAAEPGVVVNHTVYRNATALCCGTTDTPVFLPTGPVVALDYAVSDLRRVLRDDNVFGYTRPIRYVKPVEPWQPIDSSGIQFKSDLQYYSASGSVALRWLITDRNDRICRGEYIIRDDYSHRIVAQGQTHNFKY